MVCEWGMSDMGPLTYGKKEEQIFLGREIAQHRDYSEDTAIRIDREVKELVESASDTARKLLTDNIQVLHNMAHALLDRETIVLEDIKKIIEDVKSGASGENTNLDIAEKKIDEELGDSKSDDSENGEAESA
jgi:cell division protease FtsH